LGGSKKMTESNGKRRRRRIYLGAGALGVVLAIVGIVSASRSKTEIDPSKLATAEKGDIARSVVATGKIQPLSKVEIKSKASGIVKKLYADYGDTVREGQLLVDLDKETLGPAAGSAGTVALGPGGPPADEGRGRGPRPAVPEVGR